MSKKNKSETNNEWTSLPETSPQPCSCNKKNKSETDNQWTSTAKNNINHK